MVGTIVVARWAVALLTLALMVGTVRSGEAKAQGVVPAAWELTSLGGPVLQLFTRADGALYARTETGLFRGDDARTSWAPVGLPPVGAARQVEVDPTDRAVLYASGAGGLYKSTDDGATWFLLLPTERHVQRIAASPADPALVYLALVAAPGISGDFWFLRSRDGGESWEQLEEHHNSLCGWGIPILLPHPTAPSRAFRAANCLAGRNFGDALWHSADQGVTWSRVFGATSLNAADPQLAYPARLVGGRGSAPARYYLAANRDARFGGSTLFRSDDDGRTWTDVLAFRGGGVSDRPEAPSVRLGGLAYDPGQPDRVYVAFNVFTGDATGRLLAGSGVTVSVSGGTAWTDLVGQDLGMANDLALDVDGRTLYLATDRGLWRLRLDRIPPPRPPAQVPSPSR
jgi:photosystem II stability/assembly factor-like uncharacterized protein